MNIGWSKKVITWSENLNLAGHHQQRMSTAVVDDLFATAVVLDNVAICSIDLIDAPIEILNLVKAQVSGLEVILCATHNHSGYDLNLAGNEYKTFLVSQIVAAITEANTNKAEGQIAWGFEPVSIGCQKRIVFANEAEYKTEKGNKYVNPDIASFQKYDGGVDDKVQCLFTYDANNTLTGVMANVPCPAQCGEWLNKVSADYWSIVRSRFSDIFVLPLCGAAGEVAPKLFRYAGAEARKAQLKYGITFDPEASERDHNSTNYENRVYCSVREIGDKVADAIYAASQWATKEVVNEVNFKHNSIGLADATYEEEQRYTYEDIYSTAKKWAGQVNANEYEANATVTADYDLVRLGKNVLVFTGFEVYTNYALRIQELNKGLKMIVCQLASQNGTGYLADNLDNTQYTNSKSSMLGLVGGQAYVQHIANEAVKLGFKPEQYEAFSSDVTGNLLDEKSLLKATMMVDGVEVKKQSGVYNICGTTPQKHIYTLFDNTKNNINNIKFTLTPGNYKVYGVQLQMQDANGNLIYKYGLNDQRTQFTETQFPVTEEMLVTRIAFYFKEEVAWNTNVVPYIVKVD